MTRTVHTARRTDHASAVVKPGARMIKTSGMASTGSFEYQMYLNPDNTIGVLILNNQDSVQRIIFRNEEFTVQYNVPAKSIVSLIWEE